MALINNGIMSLMEKYNMDVFKDRTIRQKTGKILTGEKIKQTKHKKAEKRIFTQRLNIRK